MIVDDEKPPRPLVSSHSREVAAAKSFVMFASKLIIFSRLSLEFGFRRQESWNLARLFNGTLFIVYRRELRFGFAAGCEAWLCLADNSSLFIQGCAFFLGVCNN